MKPYPDRQSTAILRNLSEEMRRKKAIESFENLEARLFQRTLNESCSNNVLIPLKLEPNSFYCTTNTPLVTEVFKEFLTDSYIDQKDEKCDKARRICQLCLMRSCGVKHIDWNMRLTSSDLKTPSINVCKSSRRFHACTKLLRFLQSNSSCCQITCYASPHCLRYFNRECYPLDRYMQDKTKLCFRGKTLQFTLTPDFDFKNESIQCHLKRHRKAGYRDTRLEFGVNFTTLGKNLDLAHSARANSFHSYSYNLQISSRILFEEIHNFLEGNFIFRLKENVPNVENAVLIKNAPAGNAGMEFFLVDLKSLEDSLSSNRPIQLFRQREEKYVTFQNIKPFHFNTENWHQQGCSVDMSKSVAQEQLVENAANKIPVTVRIIPPHHQGAPFSYIINVKDRKIQLHISARGNHRSLMNAIFCDSSHLTMSPQLNHKLQRDARHEFKFGVTKVDKSNLVGSRKLYRIWLTLKGWVSGTPVYVTIKLGIRFENDHNALNLSTHALVDKDVILFNSQEKDQNEPQQFSLNFEVASPSVPLLVYAHLSDCQSSHYFQYLIANLDERPNYQPMQMRSPRDISVMLIDSQGLHTPLPFLLLSIFLGSLYLILFIAFLLLCLCKPRRRQFVVQALLFQGTAPLDSRTSSLSSAFTEAAKSSTSALMVDDSSPYSSPARENTAGISHSSRRLPATDSIPTSRKILIFLYVCFRAFTIFLFTFSVGLSVLLSIESESFKTLVSCVQNAKGDRIRELASQEAIRRTFSVQSARRTASPWLQELRQIEKASDIELFRQTAYFIQQASTCEMQELRASGEIGLSMAEVAGLVVARTDINKSRNRLSPNDPQTFIHYSAIVNSTWDYLDIEHWGPYNISIQRYMDNTKGLLDNQMVQHWSPFTLLLERMLDNPWLATARRAMNATNEAIQNPDTGRFSVRSPAAPRYFAGLTPADPREVEALTFAGFLGIPQPANARYAEARMWNSLRQNVHSLRPLRYFEKSLLMGTSTSQPTAILQSPDPFKYYTYSEYFTTDDLDSLSPTSAASLLRSQINQRSLTTVSSNSNRMEVFLLRDWVNIAYLRVFLLVLDAYLIVSRFYSACLNFCALWLGKRRRVYHNTRHKSNTASTNVDPGTAECLPLNEHSNDALLLTSSEIEQSNTRNEMERVQQSSSSNESQHPDLTGSVIQAQNNFPPNQPMRSDGSIDPAGRMLPDHKDIFRNHPESESHGFNAPLPRSVIATAELSNDPDAADFTGFDRRGSLPACCCCLDFHYLLILFGVCLMIIGLIISIGAGKGLGNSWLLKRSALLSRVEAIDDYRSHMRAMVHYVQLNYLNSQRLLLERNKAARQVRRLKRIQHWLHYEKEHILRQNLYEVCALSESSRRNHQNDYTLDSSICHRIRQEQQRRQQSPYPNMASRKPQKSTTSFMSSQDQLKLPLCAFLPVQSADALNSSLNPRERHTILGADKSASILSEQELRQLHQMFFKNSTFAAFLTSLYRLLFTTVLLSMCVCWLLACKHLIMQMASRTVAVVTSRVTVISPCPPASRRIETFIHSSDSSLSFHRSSVGGAVPTRLNIWHSNDDPCEDLHNPLYPLPPDPPPHAPKHATGTSQALPTSVAGKKSKRHVPFRGKSSQAKSQSDSNESRV
ncbi:hypothetical protein Aperf_G00000028982 [Anoplocephala perfoliata]